MRKNIGKLLMQVPFMLIVVTIYLSIGFMYQIWHPTWFMFLSVPLYYYFVLKHFYPRSKWVKILLIMTITGIAYLAVGFVSNVWHPTWMIFTVMALLVWYKVSIDYLKE